MVRRRLSRAIGLVSVMVVVAIGVVSAQVAETVASARLADLLTEVRELRAELNRVSSASLRMQALVARVSIQEQRMATLARQLADVQAKILAGMRTDANGETVLRSGTAPGRQRHEELRAQEAELLRVIAGEQNRWTEFNNRLEELERSVQAPGPR